MKRILFVLIFLFFLGGCAVTQTPTPATPPPAITEAAPTPTEAAPDPNQTADSLGLRETPGYEDRTFVEQEINGLTCLVDQYNNVPKAVLNEDGSWRELDYSNPEDAEIMYGAIASNGGTYIRDGLLSGNDGPWGRNIAPRFLGDWETEKIEYEGKEINLIYLIGGIRSGNGKLSIVRLGFDSLDNSPGHYTQFFCYDKGGQVCRRLVVVG